MKRMPSVGLLLLILASCSANNSVSDADTVEAVQEPSAVEQTLDTTPELLAAPTSAPVAPTLATPGSVPESEAQLDGLGAGVYDADAYCDALGSVFLVKDGSPELFVEALESAAVVALPEHRQLLLDYGALSGMDVSDFVVDPGTIGNLLDLTRPLHYHAIVECGIEIPGIRFEGENRIISPTFEPDDSGVDGDPAAVAEVTITEEASEGFYLVPPLVSGTEQLALSGFSDPGSARAAVHALVPNEVGLAFEWDHLDLTHGQGDAQLADVLVPVGWNREAFDHAWELSGELAGAEAFIFLASGCTGPCETGTWGERMEDPDVSPFRVWNDDAFLTLVDQRLEDPEGRLIVRRNLESGKRPVRAIEALVVRWGQEDDWLFRCTAWTPEEAVDAWRSLATACLASTPEWSS